MPHHLLTVIAASMAMIAAAAGAQQSPGVPSADHKVIELRQYRLTAGSQDKFIPLFDKQFVETSGSPWNAADRAVSRPRPAGPVHLDP